jgi:hypothetical protein
MVAEAKMQGGKQEVSHSVGKPQVAEPGYVLEHQRVTRQLVAKLVAQDLKDLELSDHMLH